MDHIVGLCGDFGSKNLGDGPKTGIFEFIENVGTWYKSRKIKNWSKMF